MIELTREQREIQSLARTFAQREIRPVAAHYDETETVPWPVLEQAHAAGLTSFSFPEEFGGAGIADTFTACLVAEELCWGCLPTGNRITSNAFGMAPVLTLGSTEQQRRFRPKPVPRCVHRAKPDRGWANDRCSATRRIASPPVPAGSRA